MESALTEKKGSGLREFLGKFIFFHLGRDAEADIRLSPEGALKCSIIHPRVHPVSFELNPALFEKFAADLPAFEDYLLELLTRNRRGGGNGGC